MEIMKIDRQEEKREEERRRKRARVPEEVKHTEYEREDRKKREAQEGIGRVIWQLCGREAPTGRCYDGNVLFGPSRPNPAAGSFAEGKF